MINISQLIAAYTIGYFPMGIETSEDEIEWVQPRCRGIIPLGNFVVPRRLRRRIRKGDFSAKLNADFNATIRLCGSRDRTWINRTIINTYSDLNIIGLAHSVEIYSNNQLAGGLYGVSLGGAFFGESMFSLKPMASQIALVHLVAHLLQNRYTLLDIQFPNDHLARFGAIDISSDNFQKLLRNALELRRSMYSQPFDSDSISALQRISQIS